MTGPRQVSQRALFYEFPIEDHVPPDHLLRGIDRFVDLGPMRSHLGPFYSSLGRPSVDPELMIRMLIVGYAKGIRSERRLCEEVHLNLAYRWFCRLDLADPVPDHSTFSKNRHGRIRDSNLFRHLFEEVLARCIDAGLVGGETFGADASLIKADASRFTKVEFAEWSAADGPRFSLPSRHDFFNSIRDAADVRRSHDLNQVQLTTIGDARGHFGRYRLRKLTLTGPVSRKAGCTCSTLCQRRRCGHFSPNQSVKIIHSSPRRPRSNPDQLGRYPDSPSGGTNLPQKPIRHHSYTANKLYDQIEASGVAIPNDRMNLWRRQTDCQGVCLVRRRGFWDRWPPELREGLAHLLGLIMRRICGEASVAFRWSFV